MSNSNVHRGAHQLARLSTDAYENARETVQRFIGASDRRCVAPSLSTTRFVYICITSLRKHPNSASVLDIEYGSSPVLGRSSLLMVQQNQSI